MINYFFEISWNCLQTWKKSSVNTIWWLIGCSIGNFGTIGFFQYFNIDFPVLYIMMLEILNSLITSLILETIILLGDMSFNSALKTALGMSLISMVSMEITINIVDYLYNGGSNLDLIALLLMLISSFLTLLPYNYRRLKKYGKTYH